MTDLDLKESMKKADTILRQAERMMFNGKHDEAISGLEEAQTIFEPLKGIEPDNIQVKTFESRLNKLRKDLERRTGRDLGGGTLTAQTSSTATHLPPKRESSTSSTESTSPSRPQPPTRPVSPSPTSKPPAPEAKSPANANVSIPYGARRPLQDAQNQLRSMENNFKILATASGDTAKSMLKNIQSNIEQATTALRNAQAEAAKGGASEHPDFQSLAEALVEAAARLEKEKTQVTAAAAASEAAAQVVNEDCNTLYSEYQRLLPSFDQFGMAYYNDLTPLYQQIQAIEEFESKELSPLKEKLQAFENKYGTTANEIDQKASAAGYSSGSTPGYAWSQLTQGIQKAFETRKQMAEDLIGKVEEKIASLPRMSDFHRLEYHDTIREWVKMAVRYDQENSWVNEVSANLEAQLQKDKSDFFAKIDQRTWPGNSTGPEAEAILKYFNESGDWAKNPKPSVPLGVAIHGQWSVQERNLLGQPIMHGLPAFVAVQKEQDKKDNLARVFDVTMRTGEGPEVKPEPPFLSLTVGSSYYIRPEKIK